jgi:hypothetical protein
MIFFNGLRKLPIFWAKRSNVRIAAHGTLSAALLSTEFSTGFVDITDAGCKVVVLGHV